MRLSGTKTNSVNQYRGLGDQLWDLGGARPTLDLNFAQSKDLTDATTGKDYVDFTRQSSGTYVGSDGLIKTATTNLLLRSEEFDQSPWSPSNSSISANTVANPFGDITADTLTATATTFARVVQNTAFNVNTVVLSVYAKSGTAPHLAGTAENLGLGQSIRLFANLSTGVTQQVTAAGTIAATSGSVQLADNWWRFYWIITTPTVGSYQIYWAASDQSLGFSVAIGKTLHLWGAQLEQSSTVGEYVPTTSTINSAPRFDHDPVTGESLGLLVEESRTNLLLNSATLATQNVTVTAIAHTLSFYGTGTVTLSGAHSATLVGTGAYPSRATLTFTPAAGTLTVTVSGTVEYANLEIGAGGSGASFPTSYIPTTTSTVTRAGDVASISGSNFSSWYRQNESSAFVDFTLNGVNTGNNFIYDFSNGTIDEEIFLNYQDSGNARWAARVASVQVTQDQSGAGLPRFKHAFGMASNNYMAARDGILSTGSSQVGMPPNTSLRLGARFNDSVPSNGTIRRLTYWPVRLENNVLQAITQ